MKYPYLLISDTHYHNFHQFATVDADGVNSRLRATLDETERAVRKLRDAGGDMLVHAGDAFHVRGELTPTVLNPVMEQYESFAADEIHSFILAGNHDLEGRESSWVVNASSALTYTSNATSWVIGTQEGALVSPHLLMIPYDHDLKRLRATLAKWVTKIANVGEVDVILHAPVNGVIPGLPDHGLDPAELVAYGFKRVFCGHYHNHKELVPGKVWSIGALTHQTWGDVGSKAGFMLVYEDRVQWFSTHAPQFVEIDGDTDASEIPLIVDGNYVKARINIAKESEIAELRDALVGYGAKGVVIHAERDKSATARTASVSTGASLEASIGDFIKVKSYPHEAALNALCADILNRAEAVA